MMISLLNIVMAAAFLGSPEAGHALDRPVIAAADARPLDTNLTILRLDGSAWEGDLTVWILPAADDSEMHVSLVGQVWPKGGQELAYDARFDFRMPLQESLLVPLGDSHALSAASDPGILLQHEKIAPDVVLWTSRSPEVIGALEVWQAPAQANRLSDAQVLTVFAALFDTRDRGPGRQYGCPSNAAACATLATTTCTPNRVGSVTYSCNASTQQESCSFTCMTSPPGDGR